MEFSLDDIAEILAGATGDADLLTHLQRQRESIAGRLAHYRDVLKHIDDFIHHEHEAREDIQMAASSFEIQEQRVEPIIVAGVCMTGRYEEIGIGLGQLYRRVGRHAAGKPLCLYYDCEYRAEDANFEPCIPLKKSVRVDGVSVRELPGGRFVTLTHRGPYQELGRSYARALKYAKDHGYDISLPTREVYLKGPGMIFRGNPKKYLTAIQLPIGN